MVVDKRHTPAIGQILAGLSLDSDLEYWQSRIEGKTSRDVERCLSGSVGTYSIDKILTLVSPAAEDYLEQMAQLAHQLVNLAPRLSLHPLGRESGFPTADLSQPHLHDATGRALAWRWLGLCHLGAVPRSALERSSFLSRMA